MANLPTDELLKLARYEVLDHRNATSDGVQALLGSLADEVERLNFIQREFHNVDDVAEIRDLKVRLREAIDIVRAKATASELEWSLEVESEIAADDVGAECGVDVASPLSGHRHRCVRPKGHDGEHQYSAAEPL